MQILKPKQLKWFVPDQMASQAWKHNLIDVDSNMVNLEFYLFLCLYLTFISCNKTMFKIICHLYIKGMGQEGPKRTLSILWISFPGNTRMIFHFVSEKIHMAEEPFFFFLSLLFCPDSSHFLFYIQGIMLPCAFGRIKLKNAVEQWSRERLRS